MIDLSKSTDQRTAHFHVLHTMPDGEFVLHCKCKDSKVRVSEQGLEYLEKRGGERVVLENGFDEIWEMTAAEIRKTPDYKADGPHGPFWGVPPKKPFPPTRIDVALKEKFGSTNPQLHTIQDRLDEGEILTISKTGVYIWLSEESEDAAPAV